LTLPCEKKLRTVGEILATYNCGIICDFKEIFGSESLKKVANFIFELGDNMMSNPDFITYDEGCHLKEFLLKAKNILEKI